jgi:serine/threonine protein kinase
MDKSDFPAWQKRWKQVNDVPTSSGGQGSVVSVRDAEGVIGALKELLPEDRDKHERRRRMAREVLALKKAAGPHVPRVLDDNAEQVEDLSVPLYFVEEWIEGQTLAAAGESRPRSLDEALVLTRQVGEIVSPCQARGICHRDIKPENILVNGAGDPVLVDFDVAWVDPQFRHVDDKRTAVGQVLGNRFLRLPELSAGQQKDDPHADVACLVGILFFLLTGKRPRRLVVDNNF